VASIPRCGDGARAVARTSPPIHDGLAVSADGRIVVALCDGTVLSVARHEDGR